MTGHEVLGIGVGLGDVFSRTKNLEKAKLRSSAGEDEPPFHFLNYTTAGPRTNCWVRKGSAATARGTPNPGRSRGGASISRGPRPQSLSKRRRKRRGAHEAGHAPARCRVRAVLGEDAPSRGTRGAPPTRTCILRGPWARSCGRRGRRTPTPTAALRLASAALTLMSAPRPRCCPWVIPRQAPETTVGRSGPHRPPLRAGTHRGRHRRPSPGPRLSSARDRTSDSHIVPVDLFLVG